MSLNILLIEQDDDFHDAIVDFLEKRQFGVTSCRTYAEAERALERIPDRSRAPDAIVSDADGLAFYMKARSRFPSTRWIVTAARQSMATPANPLTTAVGASADDISLSPRLADRFMPERRQVT